MSGIMMLADDDWLAFHEQHSIGKLAIFYASPHKRTQRNHLDPLFCVRSGTPPRSIIAAGRIQAQVVLEQDAAWTKYGAALGASTEAEWRKQASAVLENSHRTYDGKILAIELIDFRLYSIPVDPESVGLTDTGWGDKKRVNAEATACLLRLLEGERSNDSLEAEELSQTPSVGAGFGHPDKNKLVKEAARDAVKEQYESNGWIVRSVESEKCGYDLECYKDGAIENVEVKGVSGARQSFIITAKEVEQAHANPNFVLVIVTSALSTSRESNRYTGHEFCSRFVLSVVQYRAVIRQ
jgi:hypothetical protein